MTTFETPNFETPAPVVPEAEQPRETIINEFRDLVMDYGMTRRDFDSYTNRQFAIKESKDAFEKVMKFFEAHMK